MGFEAQVEREVFYESERVKMLGRFVTLQIQPQRNLLKANRGRMLGSDEGLEFPRNLMRYIKNNEWC